MLFKRYANPFPFIDGMIQTRRFREFVVEFLKTASKEREDKLDWEFFLHKVWDGSFKEFKESIETNKRNAAMSERTMEATIKQSMDIAKKFNEQRKG